MIRYFCDVCGAETAGGDNAPSNWTAELCRLEELCPRCEGFVKELDISALVLAELRRLAAAGEDPAQSAPSPTPKGRGSAMKRNILAAIKVFRDSRGPGALEALARLSGVEEGVLRDMIACQKVPVAVWRKVGEALGTDVVEGKG